MTIREIIEARAREAAGEIADRIFTGPASIIGSYQSPLISDIIRSAIIAILTDPQVGFKEALGLIERSHFCQPDEDGGDTVQVCHDCSQTHYIGYGAYGQDVDCTCPCHTAEAKLKELEQLK